MEDWQPAFWILWQHWDIVRMAAVFVTTMVCSNRKSKTVIGRVPDNWLKNGYPFELRRPEYAKEVKFGGYVRVEYDAATGRNHFIQEGYQSVRAIPYDMPIVGYNNQIVKYPSYLGRGSNQ